MGSTSYTDLDEELTEAYRNRLNDISLRIRAGMSLRRYLESNQNYQTHTASAHTWNRKDNDNVVRKHFKVDRLQVNSAKELLMDYFFRSKDVLERRQQCFEEWHGSEQVQYILKTFAKSLSAVNEDNLSKILHGLRGCKEDEEKKDGENRPTYQDAIKGVKDLSNKLSGDRSLWLLSEHELSYEATPYQSHLHRSFVGNLFLWLRVLKDLVSTSVWQANEVEYADMFKKLMQCFAFDVRNGRDAGLSLGKTRCNPDLLVSPCFGLLSLTEEGCIPVEAKSLYLDPEAKDYRRLWDRKKRASGQPDNEDVVKVESESASQGDSIESQDMEVVEPANPPPGSPSDSDLPPGSAPDSDLPPGSAPESDPPPGSAPDCDLTPGSAPDSDLTPGSAPDCDLTPESAPDGDLIPGSASDSDDHSTPPTSPVAGTLQAMSSDGDKDELDEMPRKKRRVMSSSWSGSMLHSYTRETINVFFSQLLGSVIVLNQKHPSEKAIGIGIVGYKIVFVTYHGCNQEASINLGDVPKTPGAKMMVQLTRPLFILNAKDREEIALALLAFGTQCNITLHM